MATVKISKLIEGEVIWTRESKSGRTAGECSSRMADRLDRRGFFNEHFVIGKGKGFGIVIGCGDNCIKFQEQTP